MNGTRLVLFILLLFASLTSAAAPASGVAQAAREAFDRGTRLYEQARYLEAASAFEEAYRAVPNPVVLYNIAQCYERLGDLERAAVTYRKYLAEAPQAPDREQVRAMLSALEARLERARRPPVRVLTTPSGATVRVDGAPQGITPWRGGLEVGRHELNLELPNYKPVQRSLEIRSGEPTQLEFVLTPLQVAQAPRPRVRSWTWIATGTAGAALAGAVTFGLLARADSKALLSQPHERPEVQQRYESAVNRQQASNILYLVAGAAGAAGVTLFFVEGAF